MTRPWHYFPLCPKRDKGDVDYLLFRAEKQRFKNLPAKRRGGEISPHKAGLIARSEA